MPIEKIKILHKFGIISQYHKKLLQERLLKNRNNLINKQLEINLKDEDL